MFTGLIREFGEVVSYDNNTLTLKAKHKPKLGDSIAVNGACLSVVSFNDNTFSVELSHESKSIIAEENLKGRVHIEPAMRLSDRFEGHIVQGHVDCLGIIKETKRDKNMVDMILGIPKEFQKFIVPKGSIAVDGVSLTINEVKDDGFRLTIISHTLKETLFSRYQNSRRVNIETDMFARYIYHMFRDKKDIGWSDIDRAMALY